MYGFNANEVFQIAIDIEENGRRFYERGTDLVGNPDVRAVFAHLAQEEADHLQRFTELKAQLPKEATEKTVWDPEHEMNQYLQTMADMNVFRWDADLEKEVSRVKSPEDVLRLGIQFEKDSIIFYLTMQDATEETKGRQFIDQLVNEEKEHLRTLTLELRKHTACKR